MHTRHRHRLRHTHRQGQTDRPVLARYESSGAAGGPATHAAMLPELCSSSHPPAAPGFAWGAESSCPKASHPQLGQLPAPPEPTPATATICFKTPVCVLAHSFAPGQARDTPSDKPCGAPRSSAQQIHISCFLTRVRRARGLPSRGPSAAPQKNGPACFTSAVLFLYKKLKAKPEQMNLLVRAH